MSEKRLAMIHTRINGIEKTVTNDMVKYHLKGRHIPLHMRESILSQSQGVTCVKCGHIIIAPPGTCVPCGICGHANSGCGN